MHEHDSPRPLPASPPSDAHRPSSAEQLVVGVALAQQSARSAVKTSAGASPAADRVAIRQRQRNGRRGVVLVFVVVLLTLLGIMGTAYLASSRLDRQAIIGRGSLTGSQTALLKDPRKLDEVEAGVERAVKIKIIRDLFNIPPGYKFDETVTLTNPVTFPQLAYHAFRQPAQLIVDPDAPATMIPLRWYHDADAPGRNDPYLSSLLAIHPSATPGDYRWPFIGAPLGEFGSASQQMFIDPYFADPRSWTGSTSTAVPNRRFASVHHTNPYYDGWNPTGLAIPPDDAAVGEREAAVITSQQLVRPTSGTPNPLWDNTRVYPALEPVIGGVGGTGGALAAAFIAGDADGDGIADGGLSPVQINLPATIPLEAATNRPDPTIGATLTRYLDTTNNVIYYASYRVVDNGAKLNLNTALEKRGELVNLNVVSSATENADTTSSPPTELRNFLGDNLTTGIAGGQPEDFTGRPAAAADGTYGPNYGFFRSDVGLVDLIRQLISPINQATDPNDYNRVPAQQELRRLVDARFPLLKQNPGAGYVSTAATDAKDIQRMAEPFSASSAIAQFRYGSFFQPSTVGGIAYGAMDPKQFYQFRSFNDLLEQQVARRPFSPAGYLWSNNGTAASLQNGLVSLGAGDATSLATKGGALVNDLISPGTAEQALMFSLRMSTPNVNSNGDAPWGYFPPNAVDLWYGWTQDFGPALPAATPPVITAIESAAVANRAFSYNSATMVAGTGAFTSPGKPAGTADVVLPRSPRALFTTYNGVTNTVPERADVDVSVVIPAGPKVYAEGGTYRGPTPGVPIGMPAYSPSTVRTGPTGNNKYIRHSALGIDPGVAGVTFSYPAQKASAATGTKEQLWRGFWSAMTQQYFFRYRNIADTATLYSSYWDVKQPLVYPVPLTGADDPTQTYSAFRSSDRWESIESQTVAGRYYLPSPGAPTATGSQGGTAPSINMPYERSVRPEQTLSTRQMALLRSAVAACNTIDLRDNDNDITAMDVDLTDDNDVLASATTPRYYARVYGTEKQLVISGLFIQTGGAGFVAVEIYNPTDVPIRLSAYRLSAVDRTRATIGTPNPLLDGSIIRTQDPDGIAVNTTIALSTDTGATLAPGGYVVVQSAAAVPVGFTPVADSIHNPAPAATPEIYLVTPTLPNQANAANLVAALALNGTRNSELVLSRTRRADGQAFVDQTAINATGAGNGVREKIENEVLSASLTAGDEAGTDTTTLVPVDAVDCRFTVSGGPNKRFSYTRQRPVIDPLRPSAVSPPGASADPPAATDRPLTGPGTTERAGAWRCFYAGQFYPLRVANLVARNPATASDTWGTDTNDDYAWQDVGGTAVTMADPVNNYAWTGPRLAGGAQGGFKAPAIPIQNFAPYDPFSETNRRVVGPLASFAAGVPDDRTEVYGNSAAANTYNSLITGTPAMRGLFHLINEFPYGSPIARDMDLLAIPYIGTYKIYRTVGTALADTALYDYVPLTMDAVAVAPVPNELYDPASVATQIKTVGRFDPRLDLIGTPYAPISNQLNDWAADLTNYVTARRQQRRTFFPDVPSVSASTTFITSPSGNPENTVAYLANDQRYAQDGPVLGTSLMANDFNDTGWVSFTERDGSTDPSLSGTSRTGIRAGYENLNVNTNTTLVQGVVNVNDAPQIVLRELPWYVNPATGQTDFTGADATSTLLRDMPKTLVGVLSNARDTLATAAFNPKDTTNPAAIRQTFGFESLKGMVQSDTTGMLKTVPGITTPLLPTAEETMRVGILNPINRGEFQSDYQYGNANLSRLSNLTSTRSDVFTVYVTVQAWTWAPGLGGNQTTDTRLVGERRTSFIVDRSKISASNFDVSNLIVLPIERE